MVERDQQVMAAQEANKVRLLSLSIISNIIFIITARAKYRSRCNGINEIGSTCQEADYWSWEVQKCQNCDLDLENEVKVPWS